MVAPHKICIQFKNMYKICLQSASEKTDLYSVMYLQRYCRCTPYICCHFTPLLLFGGGTSRRNIVCRIRLSYSFYLFMGHYVLTILHPWNKGGFVLNLVFQLWALARITPVSFVCILFYPMDPCGRIFVLPIKRFLLHNLNIRTNYDVDPVLICLSCWYFQFFKWLFFIKINLINLINF